MQQPSQTLRAFPADIGEWTEEPPALAALDDRTLIRAAAAAIARPKRERYGSFIIHAPLELLARARLLRMASPPARSRIRLRIAAIAAVYAEGDEVEGPRAEFPSAERALGVLLDALDTGDASRADEAIVFLQDRAPARALAAALADAVAGRLALAAHAPILLAGLPDAESRWGPLALLLRAPIAILARDSRPRLRWIESPPVSGAGDPASLFDALANPKRVASPSLFIAPTMLAVEADGFASRTLGCAVRGLSPDQARPILTRLAALAMLQDDPRHAPFGWTHCLSMPQGVLALTPHARDPERLVRIAATHALGFRATIGSTALRAGKLEDAGGERPDPIALVDHAGGHPDAHLAKYTLACLTAAEQDPHAAPLYLAAAAYLARWWAENPDADFGA